MQNYSIERVGKPDLAFEGELIGQSPGPKPEIRIYRTKAGQFIGQVAIDSIRSKADHFAKPADLIAWIKAPTNSISLEAQGAIEAAAKTDESIKAFWTERVE